MPTLSSTPEDKQQIREKINNLLLPLPTSIHIEINDLIESLIKQALQSQLEELEKKQFLAKAMHGGSIHIEVIPLSVIKEMKERL